VGRVAASESRHQLGGAADIDIRYPQEQPPGVRFLHATLAPDSNGQPQACAVGLSGYISLVSNASTQQITEAALKLPERDRLQVASAIWKSVGGDNEHLADLAALARAMEFETGQAKPKSQTEVFAKARAVLG